MAVLWVSWARRAGPRRVLRGPGTPQDRPKTAQRWPKNCIKPAVFLLFLLSRFQQNIVQILLSRFHQNIAHGAVRYANDAPKRFPDASVPHEQLRKRFFSGRVAQKLYKTYYFFTFFVIAFSTNYCPVWELWRAFWGSWENLWRFFGFLGRAGLARDGSQEGQGRPKTAPRRSREAGLGGPGILQKSSRGA